MAEEIERGRRGGVILALGTLEEKKITPFFPIFNKGKKKEKGKKEKRREKAS